MTTETIANSSSKKKASKTINAFEGIIIGVFDDDGPRVRYNYSKLTKKLVNQLVIHGMSAVHGGDDMLGGLFGPLPLFEKLDKRYLIYSYKVEATNTKDSRIAEHGRICSVFVILKDDFQRLILNNYLKIEKIISDYKNEHWKKELEISKDSVIVLFEELNETISVQAIRTFSYGSAGLIEFADPQMILDEGILTIIEIKKLSACVYLPKDKFSSRDRIKALEKIEELNVREYGSQLKIRKIRDYVTFKKIIDKHSVQLIK